MNNAENKIDLYQKYPYPVPVVRILVQEEAGRILILRRLSNTAKGSWCLPGGKIDYMEKAEQAARRELYEETSLQCSGMEFLFYQDSPPYDKIGMHCINLYFKCNPEGVIKLNSESGQYAWIKAEDMDKYKIAFRNDDALRMYWCKK
jgi:8-oxo-dGTP diphosphatase